MDSKTLERFMKYVEKADTCWLWTGSKFTHGYGKFSIKDKTYRAHRLALEHYLQRPVAEGMVVAHQPIICHNRACVNPEHLREATHSENNYDKKLDGTNNDAYGSKHGRAKLTEEQVIAIRADIRSNRKIAKVYAVSQPLISQIKLRKIWTHI